MLTLNWVSGNHLDVITKTYESISSLQPNGWNLEIVWTLGHSNVQANGFADILAKEAAMEVKELGEEISVMTVQGVKRHTRVNIRYKWKQR